MKTELQRLRREAGFKSAKAFAEHLGISVNTYTGYEQGKTNLALEQAWRFADVLGDAMGRYVSLDELAGRDLPRMLAELPPEERRLLDVYRDLDVERQDRLIGIALDMESAIDRGGTPEEGSSLPGSVSVA